jgi:hypothetical protein
MIFAQEFFLDAKETGRRAVTMRPFMFSTANIAVVLMDVSQVRAAAFGAGDE